MPIIGIMAFSRAQTGSYEAIQTLSGTGSSDTITFSSIPQTYKHLQIRGTQQVAYGSTDYGNTGLRLNGYTGTGYTYHFMRAYYDGSSSNKQVGGVGTGSISYALCSVGFLNQSLDTVFGSMYEILDYTSTSKQKVIRATSGGTYSTKGILQFGSSLWNSTDAITSLSLFASNGSWTTRTSFTLYGIKE